MQYRPHTFDKFVLNKQIAENLKKLVSQGSPALPRLETGAGSVLSAPHAPSSGGRTTALGDSCTPKTQTIKNQVLCCLCMRRWPPATSRTRCSMAPLALGKRPWSWPCCGPSTEQAWRRWGSGGWFLRCMTSCIRQYTPSGHGPVPYLSAYSIVQF